MLCFESLSMGGGVGYREIHFETILKLSMSSTLVGFNDSKLYPFTLFRMGL